MQSAWFLEECRECIASAYGTEGAFNHYTLLVSCSRLILTIVGFGLVLIFVISSSSLPHFCHQYAHLQHGIEL